jgi:hypothetical protein
MEIAKIIILMGHPTLDQREREEAEIATPGKDDPFRKKAPHTHGELSD